MMAASSRDFAAKGKREMHARGRKSRWVGKRFHNMECTGPRWRLRPIGLCETIRARKDWCRRVKGLQYSKTECGALMRAIDWSQTPLGDPSGWPPQLTTVVGIALGSSQPMLIVWGPEQTVLYNDGYATMCGQRHPAALGRPFRELWFDIWEHVEPIIDAAYAGIPTAMDDISFIMHRNGYPEETHFSFSYTPVRDGTGKVLGMFCACNETTQIVARQRRERQEQDQLRGIFASALGAVATTRGPEHRFSFCNADYVALTGHRDLVGRTVAQALPEVVDQGFLALLDRVYQTGEPYRGRSVQIDLRRAPGLPLERRMIDFLYHPIRDAEGLVSGVFVQALDITEQHLLNRELGHRLKNQLALVQAVVNTTFRSVEDLDAARLALEERIAVLGRAHDAIISGETQGATVTEVVESATALQAGSRRLHLDGPAMLIAPRPALSLALILHELLTNAVKYGAFSVPEGWVSIRWRVLEDARFHLVWQESGGPPVSAPQHEGAGTALIEAGLSGASDCDVRLIYAPEGLRFSLIAALPPL